VGKWILRIILILILLGVAGYYYYFIYPEKVAYNAYNNGVKLRESGNLNEAIIQFQLAISKKPEFTEAYNELAVTYGLQKKYDEAIKNIKRAIEHNSNNATAYYNLGTYYENKNMNREAAGAYRKFLSLHPYDPQAEEIKNHLPVLESDTTIKLFSE